MSETDRRDYSDGLYDIIFRQAPIVSITLPRKLPFRMVWVGYQWRGRR